MRIKRIEIEGFKSYAQRQVVDNLDSQFNAITGLNGSGKSNILDSICFLLGISNLSQVRAHNLSDLVYKQGQAGINRATVTITFDNTDPKQQPVGYSKYNEIVIRRQIIINGRNTYQINGSAATNQRVSDLFRMVGMNVNNPHFLIMQGRITKVLNMKPLEILSMVEEAAGVRMYECKKQSAVRTIEKKETKVAEICKLMDEDILPRVEKLKKDRVNYLEYQKIGREIETFERKLFAYDYHNSLEQVKILNALSLGKLEDVQKISIEIEEKNDRTVREQTAYEQMERAKADTMSAEREALEREVAKHQSELSKIESDRDGKEMAQRELKLNIDRKKKDIDGDKKELGKKRTELEKKEADIGGEEKRGKNAEEKLLRARQKLEALAKGMTTDEDGNAVTLDAQLTSARSQLSQLETDAKRADIKLKQIKPALEKKKAELQALSKRSNTETLQKDQLEAELARCKQLLDEMAFDEDAENQLDVTRRDLCKERIGYQREVDGFEAKYHFLQFKYEDPRPNFDRRSVKGVVARLFKMKDAKFATALEVAAGGKLNNIVVDRAETAKDLIQHGKLNKRTTILPLDKIERSSLSIQRLAEARRLVGSENVFLAKDLIEYDPELEPIMQNVFGTILICNTMDQAKLVTFNKQVNCRTVTISGEDFRPTGVLTGGSRASKTAILIDVENVSTSYEQLATIDNRIREVDGNFQRLQPQRQQYDKLKNQQNIASRSLQTLVDSLKHSPMQILTSEITQFEQDIPEAEAVLTETRPQIDALSVKIKELESRKKNEKAYQEKEKKQAQQDIKEAEKDLESLKGTLPSVKDVLAALREGIATLERSIEDDEGEIADLSQKLEDERTAMNSSNEILSAAKDKVKKAQQKLDTYNKEMRSHDKAIRAKATEIEELKKQVKQMEAKQESLQKEAQDAAKDSKECTTRAHKLEKDHKWIADEKRLFGVAGTPYDFKQYNYDTGKGEIEKAKDRRKELEGMINTKAMNLLGTAEEQCRELENKLPPQGASSCLEGLEVKIAFSNKWKESLGELSGGQRSLVALSLILAMLKFKPAPIYILDEVDAALDMSHTQNIGTMIKKHFTESQFIIVSLKDGMFNNANVLYRTKFVDGTSTVTRFDNTDL
ncbi:SMC proteins flexible hinge domain-containing protein [Ditylenchus destructor]|nr:SMC proteins flexible hinge domain-containing protein [Ditylenchus destructor]